MEAGRRYFLLAWRNPLGTILVAASLAVHMALALHSLYRRQRLRMRIGEALQLLLGFATPAPAGGSRSRHAALRSKCSTPKTPTPTSCSPSGLADPALGIRQAIATLVVWGHACIGIYYWLRLKPWFPRSMPWLYGPALLLPVLGLLGFVSAGRSIGRLVAGDPGFIPRHGGHGERTGSTGGRISSGPP